MAASGNTVALVVAAGSGSRAGGEAPKQYRRIGGRPMLAHALDHLDHPGIDAIQVVIGEGQQAEFRDAIGDRPLLPPVIGGASRQQSVRNGLAAISGHAGQVLIHDAARPFLPAGVIDRLLGALETRRGAVPVLPVVDTLAHGGSALGDTVARDGIVRVQTPQAFRYVDIVGAHDAWRGDAASDDAQVARAIGIDIALVEGDVRLDKLTYDEDFARAERLFDRRMTSRSGLGFDVHAFAEGDGVWLGGVRIAHAKGLAGHSDADVALHALTDALLGAIGAGDIGDHFPPGDPKWRGADSALFLRHAADLVQGEGGRIVHCDVTIICEAPKVGPHRETMRGRIAGLLGLALGRVSVKATTTERLGFTGRGEGIAAQAIATVELPEER